MDNAFNAAFEITKQPNGWILPNRVKYSKWIDSTFWNRPETKEKQINTCEKKIDTGMKLFPHQNLIKDYVQYSSPYRGILLYHGLGVGKCHAKDTNIMMYDASIKKVQNIVVGDLLMGDDSTPRLVSSLTKGYSKMYKISDIYGDSYTVNSDHMLTVTKNNEYIIDISVNDFLLLNDKQFYNHVYAPAISNEAFDIKFGTLSERRLFYKKLDRNVPRTPEELFIIRSIGISPIKSPIIIEEVGEDDYYGFEVDKNHRYIMGNFIVTHNSCASISAAEILMGNMDVVVLSPASLKNNYIDEIKKCGNKFYKSKQNWSFNSKVTQGDIEKYTGIIRKKPGFWLPDANGKPYDSLSVEDQLIIAKQIDDTIRFKYQFISYNGLNKKLILKLTENGNPFDNKCIVVDEVHNLISRIINKGHIGIALYNLLMEANNAKLVLLSGTPIINQPFEISYIVDLLAGYQYDYIIKFKKESDPTAEQIDELLRDNKYIDYNIYEPNEKKLRIRFFPKGFERLSGLKIKRSVNYPDENKLMKQIADIFKGANLSIFSHVVKDVIPLLPKDSKKFNNFFVDIANHKMINKNLFTRRIMGLVSYYSTYSPELYPSCETHEVDVRMSDHQFSMYEKARKVERVKEESAHKYQKKDAESSGGGQVYKFFSRAISNFAFPKDIKRPFPSLKDIMKDIDVDENDYVKVNNNILDQELASRDYKIKLQKAMNDLSSNRDEYLHLDVIDKYSPKYKIMIEKFNSAPGKCMLYSQFRVVEGLGVLALALETNDWCEFKIRKVTEGGDDWEIDINEDDMNKPKFFRFTGSNDETKILLRIFNGDFENLPKTLREQVLQMNKTNLNGEVIKVIMITQSGSEGISLKHVRQVHILEPYWNYIRIDQVIGRAVRTCSHIDLPVKDRNVEVFIYNMKFTTKQISQSFTINNKDMGLTSDENLFNIAKSKALINNEILDTIKSASIDCALNSSEASNTTCYSFPVNLDDSDLIGHLPLEEETLDDQYISNISVNKWKGKLLITKNGKFLVNLETNDMYDYDIYVNSKKLVKIGKHRTIQK